MMKIDLEKGLRSFGNCDSTHNISVIKTLKSSVPIRREISEI